MLRRVEIAGLFLRSVLERYVGYIYRISSSLITIKRLTCPSATKLKPQQKDGMRMFGAPRHEIRFRLKLDENDEHATDHDSTGNRSDHSRLNSSGAPVARAPSAAREPTRPCATASPSAIAETDAAAMA